MNETEFKEQMQYASDSIDKEFKNEVIQETTKGLPDNFNGSLNLVIAMEELGELQQAISKYLRGNRDIAPLNILEEMADVSLCMEWIKDIVGIKDEDLSKAINVKLNRMHRKANNNEWK